MTPTVHPRGDERGQSISLLALLIMAAMILTAGLVIDGGQKVEAASRAEAAAAGAARAAGNAGATQELSSLGPASAAMLAAKSYLAGEPDVTGTVAIDNGIVSVHTSSSAGTIFLSVIGIDHVTGTGTADANIVPTGHHR